MELKTFQDAVAAAAPEKHLLLGNGFSQACFPKIFSYGSLLEKADFKDLSRYASRTFEKIGTTDFEVVIKALQDAAKLVKLYSTSNRELEKQLKLDAAGIKKLLVNTIAEHHPSQPDDLPGAKYEACSKFLNNFKCIYSVNYDLLLYWTAMWALENKKAKINFNDGFLHPEGDDDADYVVWGEGKPYDQNIFYLHGALHLFAAESELKKFTWVRTGIRLIKQIQTALDGEMYPLVVSEGTSNQKRGKIIRSEYLGKGFRSFSRIKGALFIYGLSLSLNDAHILDGIRKSSISQMWISVYGAPDSLANRQLIVAAKQLSEKRSVKKPLEINFFNAESAQVWG